MAHLLIVTAFIVLFLLEFAAFGMQRTALLLFREAGSDPGSHYLLLPSWFPAVQAIRAAKWLLLIIIAIEWSWLVAAGLLIASFLIYAFAPIPYQHYVPAFRRRIEQLGRTDHETAQALESMLDKSSIQEVAKD